jgi:DNA-binding NtrC family response regulator
MEKVFILLVDDDENLLQGLRRSLKNNNYEIITANSGNRAIEVLKKDKIDILITDEKMPGMSGSNLTAYVRKNYPDVLCMILSGQSDIDSIIKAVNEGEIYRFLTKPCNISELKINIANAIQHLKLLRRMREMEMIINKQNKILNELEEKYPGITEYKRDKNGYIIID